MDDLDALLAAQASQAQSTDAVDAMLSQRANPSQEAPKPVSKPSRLQAGQSLAGLQYNPELGRQLQLTARAAINGASSLPNMIADPLVGLYNRMTGSQAPSFAQRQDQTLTSLGLAQPKDATERVVQAGAQSLAPVGTLAAIGNRVRSLAPLAQQVGLQGLSSVMGSTASEAAKEGGVGTGGQVGLGILAGLGGPTALSAANAGVRAALRVPGSLIAPMTESGRQNIVARAYQNAATDARTAADNIAGAPNFVPSVQPTTAEVAGDNGLSALYKALINRNTPLFADRTAANDTARQAFLSQAFGGPADIAAAKQARDAVTGPLREAAFAKASPVDTAPIVEAGTNALEAGAKYRGSGPMLQKFVNDISEISDPQVLYNGPRKAISDAIAGRVSQESPLAQFTKAELMALRSHIDDTIEASAPGYKNYLATHASLSKGIDAKKLGQEITAASMNNATDALSTPKFTTQMANRAEEVSRAGPGTSDVLAAVNADLKRAAAPLNAMRTAGSDTTQNLIGNAMSSGLLGRVPLGPLGSITGKLGSCSIRPLKRRRSNSLRTRCWTLCWVRQCFAVRSRRSRT
jgi:hypothetical protein